MTTLPKVLQEKGRQLVSRLKREVVMTHSESTAREGASVGVTFKDNKVEQ